jgi:hypothetical protein
MLKTVVGALSQSSLHFSERPGSDDDGSGEPPL